jgi:hypothetical protein
VIAFCPSSLIGNSVVANTYGNVTFSGFGCNSIDNLAPRGRLSWRATVLAERPLSPRRKD